MIRKLPALLTCLFLAACNLPGVQSAAQPQAWFDMPLPDTVFFPPNPCQLIAHGASPNGIALFELFINGTLASDIPAADSKQTLATLNITCPTLSPGRNLIELRAQDNDGTWSDNTQTIVFLAQPDALTETPTPTATDTPVFTPTASPTLTATLTPTLTQMPTSTSTPQPAGVIFIEQVSTYLIYLGQADCGPLEVTITAHAVAPNGISVVVLFYRFDAGGSPGDFENVSMNPIGGDQFQATLNPTALLGGSVPFDHAILQYQVVIQQTDGDTSLRTPVLSDISIEACGSAPPPASACSDYNDERTCIANGCSWGPIPNTRNFGCQNP